MKQISQLKNPIDENCHCIDCPSSSVFLNIARMEGDFQAALQDRDNWIRRIKNIVDTVVLDIEQSDSKDPDCETSIPCDNWTLLRKLSPQEQNTLEVKCRCTCANDDWSRIYLQLPLSDAADDPKNSDRSLDLKQFVSNTHFNGFIVLDLSVDDKEKKNELRPGLHSNDCVVNSIFHLRSCRVYRNTYVSNTFVGANVVLMNCLQVSCFGKIDPLHKITISVGAESGGGRSLSLAAESTMIDVCRQLKSGRIDSDPPSSSEPLHGFNVLLHDSVVQATPRVKNVFLSPYSSIDAANSVYNAMLFGDAKIENGSVVSNVLMQWNATISGNSTVNDVLMMEHSHLGPSSIVGSTIMGPDSHASAGEIHASIFGPSTNAHHQSLLIGILWPLGRGNVAYGSNVGSNHTGRLPDQECSVGEGIFWGLSCIVKFPTDLSSAPYSMIAAGTKLNPQRITLPFSLIVESSSHSRRNEIVPGWVLQHTPYTLARNDKKFATRRKAKRHAFYTGWKILRPSTIERCRIARNALQDSGNDEASLQDVSGIGECLLTKRARDGGIRSYTNCIQLYSLRGLLSWLKDTLDKEERGDARLICDIVEQEFAGIPETDSLVKDSSRVEWPSFPWEDDSNSKENEWGYQRRRLIEEFPMKDIGEKEWILTLLANLLLLEKELAERISKCKRRDDTRGGATVPGYLDSHILVDEDPVVMEAWEHQKLTEQSIVEALARVSAL